MNRLSLERRAAVVRCLVEGNSIRSTARIAGAAKNTVTKLLLDLGDACREYQDRTLRDLTCQRVQCDEVWSFVGCKEKTLPRERRGEFGVGDAWTWTAMDADTELMVCWLVGKREARDAYESVCELSSRLSNPVQLTTDGNSVYLTAVEDAFGSDIDYAMLVKVYGADTESEKRYSPPVCLAANPTPISGRPSPRYISTSFVERQNLTLRMGLRRSTRLTNAFSKKLENHACAVALHFMYYNFARVHQTLKTTPAVAAGVTDHVWSIEEIVGLLDSN
jgi:IS1 family transposase